MCHIVDFRSCYLMISLYILSYDDITHLLLCVCRCFLTEQTEGGGRLAAPSPPAACNRFLRLDIDNVFLVNDVGQMVILAMLLMLTKFVSTTTYPLPACNRFARFEFSMMLTMLFISTMSSMSTMLVILAMLM